MKKGRFRLSRGQRTLLNMILCALLLAGMWGIAGYPLPTAEMEFRRMERTHLVPPGEIVLATSRESRDRMVSSGQDESVYTRDGTELHLRGRWLVSLGKDCAAVAMVGRENWNRIFSCLPLNEEGPTLLPFPAGYGYWYTLEKEYTCHNAAPVLLVNVPEGTARAEIAIRSAAGVSIGPGLELDSGVWLLMPDNQTLEAEWDERSDYTLTLCREDGSLLLEKDGSFDRARP